MPDPAHPAADEFAGRSVVVTGARGALGRAICAGFAARGARVSAFDLRMPDGDEAACDGVMPFPLDVTAPEDVQRAFAAVAKRAGIDVLVNVAGVVSFGAFLTIAPSELRRVLAVNLEGTFHCCQAALPAMLARGAGRIVNIGSIVGKNGGNARPWVDAAESQRASNAAYGVSKAGVHALTWFLAREFTHRGITVNAVAPGPIATGMTTQFPQALRALIPAGRMGTADEVCEAVLFLASARAGFINGEILDVNGGLLCD